jgi:nicotinate phosphoribosyltransferase
MKMTEALPESEPYTLVVKLSDVPGKYTGIAHTILLAKEILQIKND